MHLRYGFPCLTLVNAFIIHFLVVTMPIELLLYTHLMVQVHRYCDELYVKSYKMVMRWFKNCNRINRINIYDICVMMI